MVQKGCSLESLLPLTTAPQINPCRQPVRSAARLCTQPVPELTPEPKHLHSLLRAIRSPHAMRGCRGWKHLGEDGVSPQSLENEEGDVEQMLKRLGFQQSLRKGQARGACLCTHVCNIFVASPGAALREPDLLDTCHPGRKLPSCRWLCQAVIQERGGLFCQERTFLRATHATAGRERALWLSRRCTCCAQPAPGKLREGSWVLSAVKLRLLKETSSILAAISSA